MENFESATRVEPRASCGVLQQIENAMDFAYFIQRGKSLDELFLNIEEKQKKLINLLSDCIICISFLLSDEVSRKKFLLPTYEGNIPDTKDISQIIRLMKDNVIFSSKLFETHTSLLGFIDNLCSEYFKIYENGCKGRKRSLEKVGIKLKGNPSLLNDTIRLTISPLYPKYIDFVTEYLSKTNNVFFQSKQ
jgi:hypothetical protein